MGESLPTPGYYVTDSIKEIFVDNIKQLISDLGRSVILYMPPVASGCPNCLENRTYNSSNPFPINTRYHKPFPNGAPCFVCKGNHKVFTQQTVEYTASIGRAPKDIDYDLLGIQPTNVYSTKMVVSAFEDVKRCEKAIIDGEYCVRIRDPVRTGLKDLSFLRCWWKRAT